MQLSPSIVIFTKLFLVYITSIYGIFQTDNTVNLSKHNTPITDNSSNIQIEGIGKLMQHTTNETIIPGPNLDVVTSKLNQETTVNITTLSPNTTLDAGKPTVSIALEGGGILNTQSINDSVGPVLNNKVASNLKSNLSVVLPTNNIPSTNNISNIHKLSTSVAMEGGGYEQLNVSSPKMSTSNSKLQEILTPETTHTTKAERIIPVSEEKPIDKNIHQKIAPRKGVNNTEYTQFQQLQNITKPVIKKPLFTEASDDESIHNTDLEVDSKTNGTIPTGVKSKVPSLDSFNEFSNNTQQYVIPIVIVILSVPLVTIIISFLLKRGAEWWKYRHYRRMDFLINGIYEN